MPDQPRLLEVPARPRLSARQQLAWELVRRHDGVTADEVGAHLHAHRGRHPDDQRCEWCCVDGRAVLTSKALRVLVTYRRAPGGRLYVARDRRDRVGDRDMGVIPF